jgi:hypothetical protein
MRDGVSSAIVTHDGRSTSFSGLSGLSGRSDLQYHLEGVSPLHPHVPQPVMDHIWVNMTILGLGTMRFMN